MPDFNAFYEHMRTAEDLPTTSQPSIGDFLEVWQPLLDSGKDIVSIHLAAGMSGTYGVAEQTRDKLLEEGVDAKRIAVVNSRSACGGLGLLVLAAAACARRGADAPAVAEHVERAREQLKLWFCIETLEYLRRGGRLGGARGWIGSTLRIKPILTVEQEITPVERVRTWSRAFERMLEYLRSCHEGGADAYMVQHIQAPDELERLTVQGREIFGDEPTISSEIGPVIGAHTGPGLIGVGALPSSFLR
jgi:DegV family protein with EDD domain